MHHHLRKGCLGAKYLPLDTLVNWMSKKISRNGRRIRRCVEELEKEGYILLHKNGEAISLNPRKRKEINQYIEKLI